MTNARYKSEEQHEQAKAKARDYYSRNKDKWAARMAAETPEQREERLARGRQYYEKKYKHVRPPKTEEQLQKQREYMRGYTAANKEKTNARVREWQKKNPDKVLENQRKYRARHGEEIKKKRTERRHSPHGRELILKNLYGLTLAQYDAMFAAQDGKCAICKKPPRGTGTQGLHVDHNHATNKVRALLCNVCNARVGIHEHPDRQKYLDYIKHHEAT